MVSNAKKLQLCIFCWVGLRVGFFPVAQNVTPSPPRLGPVLVTTYLMRSRVPQAIPYFISVPRTSRVFVAVIEISVAFPIPLVAVNTCRIGRVPVLPLKTQPIRWLAAFGG